MITFPIFDKLGGEQSAMAILEAEGHPVGVYAIHKWKRIGRLSAPAKIALMKECIKRGISHDDADYLAVRDRPQQFGRTG